MKSNLVLINFKLSILFFLLAIAVISQLRAAEPSDSEYVAPTMQIKEFAVVGIEVGEQQTQFENALAQIIKASLAKQQQRYDIAALRELTNQITDYYHTKGYFLATSFIPEQKVEQGKVLIQVLQGQLAYVQPESNRIYKNKTLQNAFAGQVGKGINKEAISRQLLLVNDFPGFSGMAVFSPVETIGHTNLILKTKQENKFNHAISDNYGSLYTGRYRLQLSSSINNVSSAADQLSFNFVQTLDPNNSRVFAFNYRRPLLGSAWLWHTAYSLNRYEIGDVFTDLDIAGNGQTIESSLLYKQLRSQQKNRYYSVGVAFKQSRSQGIGQDLDDQLWLVYSKAKLNGFSQKLKGRYDFDVSVFFGFDAQSSQSQTRFDEKFGKIQFTGSQSLSFQALPKQFLLPQWNSQYSGNLLNASERLALGGANSVRVYASSAYSVDSGVVLNSQWMLKSGDRAKIGWLADLQLSLFSDLAFGQINHEKDKQLTGESNRVWLSGIGVGVALNPKRGLQLNFDASYALNQVAGLDQQPYMILFNLGYKL